MRLENLFSDSEANIWGLFRYWDKRSDPTKGASQKITPYAEGVSCLPRRPSEMIDWHSRQPCLHYPSVWYCRTL